MSVLMAFRIPLQALLLDEWLKSFGNIFGVVGIRFSGHEVSIKVGTTQICTKKHYQTDSIRKHHNIHTSISGYTEKCTKIK